MANEGQIFFMAICGILNQIILSLKPQSLTLPLKPSNLTLFLLLTLVINKSK